MNELTLLIDMVFKLGIVGALIALVAYMFRSGSEEVFRVRKEYESRIKELKERLNEYRERLDELRKQHREELAKYSRMSKMLIELKNALDSGAVKLTCPKHPESSVTVLADGTIVCSKGHRVWPPEKEEVKVEVGEVEEG